MLRQLRQSPSRNHRGRKLRPKHSLQVFLLVAVSIWLTYRLTYSYSKRRAVAVETDSDGMDGELTRRRLSMKDLVNFADDASGEDGVPGVGGGGSNVGSEDDVERESASDRLSKGKESDSNEEDEESDEDGLPGDEEEDLQPENGDGEDELKTTRGKTERASASVEAHGGTRFHQPNELRGSVVPRVNATDGVQDGAAVPLVNGAAVPLVNGAAADGIGMIPELNSSQSPSKNSASDVLFNGRGATGDVAKNLLFNDAAFVVPGAEKPTNDGSAEENRVVDRFRQQILSRVKTGSYKAEDKTSEAEWQRRCGYPGQLNPYCRLNWFLPTMHYASL